MAKSKNMNRLIFVWILLGMLFPFITFAQDVSSEQILQQVERLHDPDKEVRYEAAQSLIAIGKPAVSHLLSALEKEKLNSSDETIRARSIHRIVYVLGKIGDKSRAPHLFNLLEDKDGNVGIYATEALCSMGDESIIVDLIKFAVEKTKSINEDEVKKKAQELQNQNVDGMMKLSQAASFLEIPITIASGISNMGESVIPTLIGLLNHNDYEVRLFTIGLLENLGMSYRNHKKKVIESFIGLLSDDNPKVRQVASTTLAYMTDIKYKTGKDFGEDKSQWLSWWENNKKQFE